MDFSCDVRKKYLLLECIDCFNGREQRAQRQKEGTEDIEECTRESISLIRSLSGAQAHTQRAACLHALVSDVFCLLM